MDFRDLTRMTLTERSDYIVTAATNLGISELIVEKDLWVVWMLEQLFALSAELGPFTFKGGTSLSKGFHAIQRFSEDIDISISRAKLGFQDDSYFYDAGSIKKTKSRVEEIRAAARSYTEQTLLLALRTRIAEMISSDWTLKVEEGPGVRFQYPTSQRGQIGYIRPDVLIEFGHADTWPANDVPVTPYIVDALENVTGSVTTHILDPRRTFWEKATILHEIAHRDEALPFPERYSRHYYDLARLGQSQICEAALSDKELLAEVVRFKQTFFVSNRAQYDLAKAGTLRLVPPTFRREAIAEDYRQMLTMIFGEAPRLDEILRQIGELEARINQNSS